MFSLLSTSSSASVEQQGRRSSSWYYDLIATVLVVARCAWVFAAPLRAPDLPLRFAQDDFFYYLKPAQNLAWLHRSTFDGTVLTNGYHPLYFLLVTAASFSVHTLSGVFRMLWVLDVVSAAAIFLLVRRVFARVAAPLLANALAATVVVLCVPILCDQMEVTLALPLGFAFLLTACVAPRRITTGRAAAMGLLGGLTFLARLDAVLLVLLALLAMLFVQAYRSACSGRNMASFCAGFLPLPLLYVLLNEHYFHALLPVSAAAKQLRHHWGVSMLVPASFNGTSELLLGVTLGAAVLAFGMRKLLRPAEMVFVFATLGTPLVFYMLEACISDWQLWNWYYYDLRFAVAGVLLLLTVAGYRFASRRVVGVLACGVALVLLWKTHYKVDDVMAEIQHASGVLSAFAGTHPGKFAMGDRAGMFAISSDVPVLQTEGLMEDRAYLNHIRAQEDLRAVLASYGVEYYVAFVSTRNAPVQITQSCLHAMEPSIAGPNALRMRSDFCANPELRFAGNDGEYFVYRVRPN